MADTPMTPAPTTQPRRRRPFAAAIAALVTAMTLTGCSTTGAQDRAGDAPAIIEQNDEDAFEGTLVDPPLQVAPVTR